MNITLDKQNTTDALIKIKLTESDYLPKVEEKLREYSRKANIKGFRQGKVPSSVVKKMFGKPILAEIVNQQISHSLSDYIKDNKLRILGDPLPNSDKARAIDWDNQKDFEFEFQVGMVDDFQYELSSNVKIKSYAIEMDDKVLNDALTDLKLRFGKVTNPEVSEVSDNLFGEIVAVDGARTEEAKKSSYISIEKVEKEEQKKFIGLKKDDEIEFDITKIFTDKNFIAQAINISAEEAKSASGKYTVKITTISRSEAAEINPDFFDKVFGKDVVKTEEEFIAKIKETIAENYKRETDHLLDHEIQHHFVDNTKMNMPDNFLKLWLKATSGGKVTDDILEKEFVQYKDTLKWDLVKNKIAEDLKITVGADAVKSKAKEMILQQFGGQAFAEQPGDKMDGIVDNYLSGQDGKNFMNLYNQLRSEKIMKAIRETITLTEKKVSLDEFKKVTAEHNH